MGIALILSPYILLLDCIYWATYLYKIQQDFLSIVTLLFCVYLPLYCSYVFLLIYKNSFIIITNSFYILLWRSLCVNIGQEIIYIIYLSSFISSHESGIMFGGAGGGEGGWVPMCHRYIFVENSWTANDFKLKFRDF